MSLFKNLFGGSSNEPRQHESQSLTPETLDFTSNPTPSVERNDFVSDTDPEYKIGRISYGTGCPIDSIYAFVTRDYEDQGYQDALVNCDMSYRKAKEELLRNSLSALFAQVKLRYNDDIRKLNVQIRSAEEQMINSAVEMLKAQIKTYESHLVEIDKMEKELANNSPRMTLMVESYTRGFLKGVAAQSMGFITKPE